MMISRKTQIAIDKWESRTSVFVNFGEVISLEGAFLADELSDIASIQRRRKRELQPPIKFEQKQKGLFD